MANTRPFGRRNAPGVQRSTGGEPTDREASVAAPPDLAIASTGGRVSLLGEVVGFVGLLLLLLATALTPPDPTTLDAFAGKVSIPHILFEHLPDAASQQGAPAPAPDGSLTGMVFMALLVSGVIAANRKRWMLAGLTFAAFAFPWSILGVTPPFGALPALLIAFVAGLRFIAISGVRLLAITVLAVLVGPSILDTVEVVLRPFSGPSAQSAMFEPRAVPSTVRVDASDRMAVVAAAYVGAQKAALGGELTVATAILQRVGAQSWELSVPDGRRLAQLNAHLKVSGTFGADQQQAARAQDAFARFVSIALGVVGVVAIVTGPLIDRFGGLVLKRAGRVRTAHAKLDLARTQNGAFSAIAMAPPLRTGSGAAAAASADGLGAVERVNRRIKVYASVVTTSLIAAVGGLFAYWALWLPAADSNTAFSAVGVVLGSKAWLGAHGIRFADVFDGPGMVMSVLMPVGIVACLVLAFVYRRLAKWFTGGLVAILAYALLGGLAFVDQLPREVNVTAITDEMRLELQESIAAGVPESTAPTVSATFADVRRAALTEAGQLSQIDPNARSRPDAAIAAGEAAYILAQIAYIENRPWDIGPLLGAAVIDPDLVGHNQRLDLMAEWAMTRGAELPGLPPSPLLLPMSVGRAVGDMAVFVALVGVVSGLAATLLYVIASNRRQRIAGLVRELSRPNIESAARPR